jgi:hypothetical protein
MSLNASNAGMPGWPQFGSEFAESAAFLARGVR